MSNPFFDHPILYSPYEFPTRYWEFVRKTKFKKRTTCHPLHQPGDLSYGELKLMPFWDPLRGDPRFEQIVASLAPKDAASPTK